MHTMRPLSLQAYWELEVSQSLLVKPASKVNTRTKAPPTLELIRPHNAFATSRGSLASYVHTHTIMQYTRPRAEGVYTSQRTCSCILARPHLPFSRHTDRTAQLPQRFSGMSGSIIPYNNTDQLLHVSTLFISDRVVCIDAIEID